MKYTIKPILDKHEDKDGNRKVVIQVTYNRTKSIAPTIVRVSKDEFNGTEVVKHKQRSAYNTAIKSTCSGVETRLLDRLKFDSKINKEELHKIVKDRQIEPKKVNTGKLYEFIEDTADDLKGKVTDGRVRHYKAIATKIKNYAPKATLSDVNLDFLEGFEKYLRIGDKDKEIDAVAHNTIVSNMSILIRMIHIAMGKELIEGNPMRNYKRPNPKNTIPTYLLESEIATFQDMVEKIQEPRIKLAGYYYLLSCYAGYRISDAKTFDMSKLSDGKLILRAKKNGEIVSIAVHTRLQTVLDYIKDKPLDMPEQKVRTYVHEISKLCGIKKHVNYHSSRHSFAMLLRKNGFSIEEIAEFLGDSKDVARIYARIDNTDLNKKILDRLS